MTAVAWRPSGWPTTSSSVAPSTSRASRRRRRARTTRCESWRRRRESAGQGRDRQQPRAARAGARRGARRRGRDGDDRHARVHPERGDREADAAAGDHEAARPRADPARAAKAPPRRGRGDALGLRRRGGARVRPPAGRRATPRLGGTRVRPGRVARLRDGARSGPGPEAGVSGAARRAPRARRRPPSVRLRVVGDAPAAAGMSVAAATRARVRVEGTVQGVGFRPFVYRLAGELGLAIVPSERHGEADAPVSPDSAPCDDCLRELFDPADRRYRYPFINCTNCGPRFTIVRGVPYDRPLTTMAAFEMCAECLAEYDDPDDRRFHAQPNACPACGPSLSAPLSSVVDALRSGAIAAVKGLGGYHLACRCDDEAAVARLRARKHREDKPFALMAADLVAARALVELTPTEEELLVGRARPIVIARRRPGAAVAELVAPASPDLGVMLPYTPLHHLLLHDVGGPLVMTSGNVSDEPIAYEDEDAGARPGPNPGPFLFC